MYPGVYIHGNYAGDNIQIPPTPLTLPSPARGEGKDIETRKKFLPP